MVTTSQYMILVQGFRSSTAGPQHGKGRHISRKGAAAGAPLHAWPRSLLQTAVFFNLPFLGASMSWTET